MALPSPYSWFVLLSLDGKRFHHIDECIAFAQRLQAQGWVPILPPSHMDLPTDVPIYNPPLCYTKQGRTIYVDFVEGYCTYLRATVQ